LLRIQILQIKRLSFRHRRSEVVYCALFFLSALFFSDTIFSKGKLTEQKKAQQQLTLLRKKINAVSQTLRAHRQQHSAELYQLNLSEKRLALLTRQLKINTRQQQREHAAVKTLKRKRTASRLFLNRQLSYLGEEARLAFLQGSMSTLKILLSKHSLAVTQRGFVYHRYIQRYRQQRIALINKQLARLKQLELAIDSRQQRLRNLRQSFQQQQLKIVTQYRERRLLLKQLALQMSNATLRLQANEKSRLELATILKVIKTSLGNLPVTNIVFKTFQSSKGSMRWPVSGVIVSRFGQKGNGSSLHHRGVFIRAAVGSQVSSISYGRVVYADWLRGYGLIAVIDHGDNFLSLYGHNQTLYKRVGDWVKAGEVIAATGDSGGLGHSGLYFEIRRQGIPLNPAKWCLKSVKKQLTSRY